MRTTRVLLWQSCGRKASTTLARAAGFSSGAHASSRSRNTSSAALAAAFSIIRGLLPGTARTERRSRAVDTTRLLLRRGGPVVGRCWFVFRRARAIVERNLTVVGRSVGTVRVHAAEAAHPAEQAPEHL